MFDILQSLYYRIRLGELLLNNNEAVLPNYVAKLLLDHSWKSLKELEYECMILLDDNRLIKFWNANKYYSWFSSGSLSLHDEELTWQNLRPSVELLYKVKCKVEIERQNFAYLKLLGKI